MLFQTLSFILFALIVLALYWLSPRTRLMVLALANAVFYLAAGWQNLALFLAASIATYLLGGRITGRWGRVALALGIAFNLGNLATFKYSGFFLRNLHALLPVAWLAPGLVAGLVLPIGISFYTFQNIAYLVDRRFKGLEAAPSFWQYWVYISFFGHSIAGPIMRGAEFLPQVAATATLRIEPDRVKAGLGLFLWGLVKKIVLADSAARLVDPLFARATGLGFGGAWTAALLFAFQIYYDFSAYSDMAVGIGHLFGFTLTQNFRTPYVARNGSEFWARWHITLSRWIRDYVYIPLGGSRCARARHYLNLFVAMVASGFWHGAAWTFVAWGGAHGVLLLGAIAWGHIKMRLGWRFFDGRIYHVLAVGCFFWLLTFTWVLFRATSLTDVLAMWHAMLDLAAWRDALAFKAPLLLAAGLYCLHLAEHWLRERKPESAHWWEVRVPVLVQGLAYAAIVLIVVGANRGPQDFIYFRF